MYNKFFCKNSYRSLSPHLYASFGNFYAKIGQLFVAQWVQYICMLCPGWFILVESVLMSSIFKFFWMFKDSLHREWLTNFDAKGAKRSVKMWTTNLYKIFFQKYCVLVYMNARLSKICSVHKYVILRTVYFGRICVQIPKSPKMELIFFENAYYIKKNTCKSYKEWSSLMQI